VSELGGRDVLLSLLGVSATLQTDTGWEMSPVCVGRATSMCNSHLGVINTFAHLQVFSNMTSNIRRALFEVVMVLTFDNENSLVIDNGTDVSVAVHVWGSHMWRRWGVWRDSSIHENVIEGL